MRSKHRPLTTNRPLYTRLVFLSFFLGLTALFVFTNFSFWSTSAYTSARAELTAGGEFPAGSRSLLDPGVNAALPDLIGVQHDARPLASDIDLDVHLARHTQQAAAQRRRTQTLVLYVYNALDTEQQNNFHFFMRWAVQSGDGVAYKIILTEGSGVLDILELPQLPANAEYLRSRDCTSTWGALSTVMSKLPLDDFQYYMVVDSSVKGPFVPEYAQKVLHWSEIFTERLTARVKMVGSAISCEGSPKEGDVAGEWRENPYVLPYAWATDKAGWNLLREESVVFRCYTDPWDTRYYSDSGASLAVLKAGYNLDTLLTRYQGIDWWSKKSWTCNGRMRPDGEMYYDGVSITPYETVFVPVSLGYAQNAWSFVKTAAKYEEWMAAKADGKPKVNQNAWVSDSMSIKAQQLVYMNARGPGCFDFRFYLQHNPDLSYMANDPLELWEHFLLLGQFQGRVHRFSCPVQIGNSYRVAYAKARGHTCFDHNYYVAMAPDLKVLPSGHDLYMHYVGFGQFENRQVRYACADSFRNLTRGFEEVGLRTDEQQTQDGGAVEGQQQEVDAAGQGAEQQQQQLATAADGLATVQTAADLTQQ